VACRPAAARCPGLPHPHATPHGGRQQSILSSSHPPTFARIVLHGVSDVW
jgi:hypothetical protein